MTVGIVTDSAAAIPGPLVAEHSLVVVPMWLNFDGRSVHDGDVPLAEVTTHLAGGFTTSGPTPGEFAEAIAAADRGDGVLVATLASAMSGTYQSAILAAQMAEGHQVEVVDTLTAAGAEALVVLAAASAADGGLALDAVAAAARAAAGEVSLVATLPALDHLAKGGRVPGAAAWAGRWLDLNPLFEFRGGHVHPMRPARGRRAAYERLVGAWAASISAGSRLHVAVSHALDPGGAEAVLELVRRRVEPTSSFVGSFSPVMVAHTGPGLVGLSWRWERADDSGGN